MDKPKQQYDAKDFGGVQLQADINDLSPGVSQDQVNIQSDQEGSMRVRLGCKQVTFDS